MKRCPMCGANQFCVTAHVTQGWIVDENEQFVEVIEDCEMVTHFPNDDDLWMCRECAYEATGKEFNMKEGN